MIEFKYSQNFSEINFRQFPHLYQIGRGEQGVLLVEPYKSEILPYWRFKTPEQSRKSAEKIFKLFLNYKKQKDFVGMDMARKFLQMGYTRSRRYANHAGGRKYEGGKILPQAEDWEVNEKAQSAKLFYHWWKKARTDPDYLKMRKEHRKVEKALEKNLPLPQKTMDT